MATALENIKTNLTAQQTKAAEPSLIDKALSFFGIGKSSTPAAAGGTALANIQQNLGIKPQVAGTSTAPASTFDASKIPTNPNPLGLDQNFGTKQVVVQNPPPVTLGDIFKKAGDVINSVPKALIDSELHPSEQELQLEQAFTTKPDDSTYTKVVDYLPNLLAKGVFRFFQPIFQPYTDDLAQAIVAPEFTKQVADGTMSYSAFEQAFPALQKSNLQVLGDSIQAGLAVYMPNVFGKGIAETFGGGVKGALATGLTTGAEAGGLFGTAQVLSSGTTDPATIADIYAKNIIGGAILGGLTHAAVPISREAYTKATQDVITKFDLPKEVYISPQKVEAAFKTSTKPTVDGVKSRITPEEADLVRSLGLSEEQYAKAVKEGVTVAIPATKVIQITDKPYFSQIKDTFGFKPTAKTITVKGEPHVAEPKSPVVSRETPQNEPTPAPTPEKAPAPEKTPTPAPEAAPAPETPPKQESLMPTHEYPTIHQGGVVKMVQGEPVKIIDGVETFAHKGDGGWVVSEASTGRFLAESKTQEGAISKAKFNINQVGKDKFVQMLNENKIPPEKLPQKNNPKNDVGSKQPAPTPAKESKFVSSKVGQEISSTVKVAQSYKTKKQYVEDAPKPFHAIKIEDLQKIEEAGGKITAPSIGIAKNIEQPAEYGDIVLIPNDSLLNKAKFYTTDIWSPTLRDLPTDLYVPKRGKLYSEVAAIVKKEGYDLKEILREAIQRDDPERHISIYLDNSAESYNAIESLASKNKLKGYSADEGNASHLVASALVTKLEKTPENISKYLQAAHTGENVRGVGSMFAGSQNAAESFKYSDISKYESRLSKTSLNTEELFSKQQDAREALNNVIGRDTSKLNEGISDSGAGQLAGAKTYTSFRKMLAQDFGENLSKLDNVKLKKAYTELRDAYANAPTDYFEGKSLGTHSINEFPAVITTNKEAIALLNKMGYTGEVLKSYGDLYTKANERSTEAPVSPKVNPENTKTSKVAKSIEAQAVEKGLTDSFKDLAGYEPATVKEQAAKVSDLIEKDLPRVRDIVSGKEKLPEDIRGAMFIAGVEKYATDVGDVGLLQDLAKSPITSETSVHASELRLLQERLPESPVKLIQDVQKAREKAVTKSQKRPVNEAKTAIAKDISNEIKKAAPKRQTWEQFIQSIEC